MTLHLFKNYHHDSLMTPWGKADHASIVGLDSDSPRVFSVSTPSHGGMWIKPPDARKHIPAEILALTFQQQGERGWFEEDCDWEFIALAFPERFLRDMGSAASLAGAIWSYHPDRGITPEQHAAALFRDVEDDSPNAPMIADIRDKVASLHRAVIAWNPPGLRAMSFDDAERILAARDTFRTLHRNTFGW